MEVVVLGSIVSELAVRLADNLLKRATTSSSIPPNEPNQPLPNRENVPQPATEDVPQDEPEEGSIPALRKKLKELQLQAKQLNSPDTFVQYAKVTREANKVEKELLEKEGTFVLHVQLDSVETEQLATDSFENVSCVPPTASEPRPNNGLNGLEIVSAMSRFLAPKATKTVQSRVKWMTAKLAIRMVILAAMWMYFSWQLPAGRRGEVMAIDCRAFRPLSILLRKRDALCGEDDWTCASRAQECVVSYYYAFGICNMVIRMVSRLFANTPSGVFT